jgi:hypothetical protein
MPRTRKTDQRGRSAGEPRFIQIPYWVLETSAALALSGTAFKVLVYLLKRFNGVNNGRIAFGARSGCFVRDKSGKLVDASIGLKPRTIADALYELEKAGFIRCTHDWTFHQKRHTREWRFTWLAVGTDPPTKEFATAVGDFKRPRTARKQKPVHVGAESSEIQCTYAHEPQPELAKMRPTVRAAAR